jgi:predicted nucleic acid-binding Zn ribbon protein
MPSYNFRCNNCDKSYIVSILADKVNNDKDWNKVPCPKCKELMDMVFDIESIPNFIFKGEPPLGRQVRNKREAEKASHIASQEFESKTELQEGMGRAADLEKEKGLTPGSLTTGVKAVSTKEDLQQVRTRDRKKREEAKKARRKMGLR